MPTAQARLSSHRAARAPSGAATLGGVRSLCLIGSDRRKPARGQEFRLFAGDRLLYWTATRHGRAFGEMVALVVRPYTTGPGFHSTYHKGKRKIPIWDSSK